MNLRLVFYLVSNLVLLEGVLLACIGLLSRLVLGDPPRAVCGFLACSIFSILLGTVGIFRSGDMQPQHVRSGIREGFLVVVLGWLAISFVGCLPYIIIEKMYLSDALFETFSGFTTTGATVIESRLKLWGGATLPHGIESLTKGILLWRSLTHWIGGMGIVLFSLAILPMLGIDGKALYNAEVPGVKKKTDQLTPKISQTAKILCLVYTVLTVTETLLLWVRIPFFDALCHSFSTIATGGFSTKNLSIAAYHSPYVQLVIMLFMFLAGCNFILHIRALRGLPWKPYLTEEYSFYVKIIGGTALLIAASLFFSNVTDSFSGTRYKGNLWISISDAAFQVISMITTTGFSSANYMSWPVLTSAILLGLMFIGGCGGSTAGGMKCIRVLLLWKFSWTELKRHIFPRIIRDVRLDGSHIDRSVIHRILAFVSLYIMTIFLFMILLTFTGEADLLTVITASISMLGNCGPAFGQLGPDSTFCWLSPAAKILLSLEMLIGRLELYTVFVLFFPSFWKK